MSGVVALGSAVPASTVVFSVAVIEYVPGPINATKLFDVKSNVVSTDDHAPAEKRAARFAHDVPSAAPADDVEKYRVTIAMC